MKTVSENMVQQLINKGVAIPSPQSVTIGDDIDIDRISGNGTVFHSGTKILGRSTLIMDNVTLGYEAPATIDNCHIGSDVQLKGGFFSGAVFLKKAQVGSGAHVRQGTILEEEASGAHTVGLKQTILFPFVTLGSLINFCDCFMAGGTSRKDHSEVGSSFIHFNYTPEQDKATPSLLGDVPSGVMLNQKPIFLGGQGGIVGPIRLAFGTITAAGSIIRKDEVRKGRLLMEGITKSLNVQYPAGSFRNMKRNVRNNVLYIANLYALRMWYHHARSMFVSPDFPAALFMGLNNTLDSAIQERMKRLKHLADKIYNSAGASNICSELHLKWDHFDQLFEMLKEYDGDHQQRDVFLSVLNLGIDLLGKDYIAVIKGLDAEEAKTGTIWLQGIVEYIWDETIHLFDWLD